MKLNDEAAKKFGQQLGASIRAQLEKQVEPFEARLKAIEKGQADMAARIAAIEAQMQPTAQAKTVRARKP